MDMVLKRMVTSGGDIMRLQKGGQFAEDPENFIREAIERFVEESPANIRKVDQGRYFGLPLVGFASGSDPLFEQYKEIIGDFHFSPQEIFDLTFGKRDDRRELSVISWILPIAEDTRKANRKETEFPALLWSHTRYFGEPFNVELRNHVAFVLERQGCRAVAPSNSHHFIHHMHAPGVGFTSNWSERHAAYACGLGTFGLCSGFITHVGKAIRIGTVVAEVALKPSLKPYPDHHANCLYYSKGTCKACSNRCPAGAISTDGRDKDKCYDYMHAASPPKKAEYGVQIAGCGLCQTKVPCEFEIPKAI